MLVTIDSEGTVRFLVGSTEQPFYGDASTVKRASHVEPANVILRAIFYGVRAMVADTSRVAEFTRHWGCQWRINLSPINGPILSGTYRDRLSAIDREIDWLNENFL